mgnify:CR=1 FL=1|jgi:Flp pilus assembly pilin Flp
MGPSMRTRGVATFVAFWNDDGGLVTLEWVGLAAAVIVLAVGVISLVQGPVNTAASTIGTKVVSSQTASNDQADSAHGPCSAPGLAIAASHASDHASLCQAR